MNVYVRNDRTITCDNFIIGKTYENETTEEQYVYFITTKEIRTAKVDGVVIEFGGVARMTFNKTGDDGNTYSHAYWAHRTKDKYAAGHHVFELTFS